MNSLLLIILPIAGFFTGHFGVDQKLWPVGVVFNLVLLACWWWFFRKNGYQREFWLSFFLIGIIAILIESIALKTCWPYGCFDYGLGIGPRINGDLAPWFLPISVWPVVVVAYFVLWVEIKWLRTFFTVLKLVALDLLIDPLAVKIGLWKYADSEGFWGVPLSNFGGWLWSGLVFAVLMNLIWRDQKVKLPIFLSGGYILFWIGVLIGIII